MTLAQNYQQGQVVPLPHTFSIYCGRNRDASTSTADASLYYSSYNVNLNQTRNYSNMHDFFRNYEVNDFSYNNHCKSEMVPSAKRRKYSTVACGKSGLPYQQPPHDNSYCKHPSGNRNFSSAHSKVQRDISIVTQPVRSAGKAQTSTSCKRDRSMFEEESDVVFVSRDEIERCSPSRKDGIDAVREAHLRYSYCAFLQNLGVRLDVPQPTIGTAMVLCHRFFFRRSHACHDRFLIATAALFLAAKYEEAARPLNDVLLASSEILHNRDFTSRSYMLPADWFEKYKERVLEAEHVILTTLNFELSVQHPYASLTSTLEKLGFAQTVLVNLALNLVSEGVYFKISARLCHILSWRLICCAPKCFVSHLKLNVHILWFVMMTS